MSIFLITYLTITPDQEQIIVDNIKRNSAWARIGQCSYCVRRENDNVAIVRESVRENVSGDFRVFVVDITRSAWGSYNLPASVIGWLKDK